MTQRFVRVALLLPPLILTSCSVPPPTGAGADPWSPPAGADAGAPPGWTLTWSDEFDGPEGSAVDGTKWGHDVGGGGWGNQELELYTDGTQNAYLSGGTLVIEADRASAQAGACWYGACEYTSARITTQGKFAQAYGRFEASIQIPSGKGLWPAFWLLGDDVNQVGWPACGEVDVMENAGAVPGVNHGSLHEPGNPPLTATYTAPASLAAGYHTYAIDWSPDTFWFYVDDDLYETQASEGPAGAAWPFDHPFFILLNVAVGGTFGGAPDATTVFPQTMRVDWVRVYQQADGGA
jgi:beta-glucanase (GH16 family)